MNKKKILVTGGAGFIGTYVVERLVKKGYTPVILDNHYRGRNERLKELRNKIEIVEGDIRNKGILEKAARGSRAIFHLAFINGTRYFYEKPELVLEVGVKGALNTLEVALEEKMDKYILISSSEVYHEATHIPTPETERLIIPDVSNPRYSYAGAKIISELLVINYLRKTSVKHCIIRPHNVFGPQMGFEHVIPELMQKLYLATRGWQKKECEIEIEGKGKESRAFCFVEDAVEQMMIVFEKGRNAEIYHVGMDKERTIRQLITQIGKLLGIQIKVRAGKLKLGSPSRRCPSIEKVCSLGYAKHNHFTEGLKKTVAWYKHYFQEKAKAGGS